MSQLDRQNSISSIDLNQSIEEIKDNVLALDEPCKTERSFQQPSPDLHNKTIQEFPRKRIDRSLPKPRKKNMNNRSFTGGATNFLSNLKVPKLKLKRKPKVQYILVHQNNVPALTSRSSHSRQQSPSPQRNLTIQNEEDATNYTHLQPGMPGYNQVFHSNQSMGQSSTMMPCYTYIVPKNQEFYANIAKRAKIPPMPFEVPIETGSIYEEGAEVDEVSPQFNQLQSEKPLDHKGSIDDESGMQYQEETFGNQNIEETQNTRRSDTSAESVDHSIEQAEQVDDIISSLFETPKDYDKCAKFGESNFSCVDENTLQLIRWFMLVPISMMFLAAMIVNGSLMWFFYYESFWALILTTVSIQTSALAVKSKKWQSWAVISAELAFAFNMVVTPFFWFELSPEIFYQLDKDTTWVGTFMKTHLTTLHSLPLILLLINIGLTKIVFLCSDHKFCGIAGFIYMFSNAFGSIAIGHPLYPILDWDSISSTVFYFLLQCFLLQAIHYLAAISLQKIHKFEE